jgi:hypothetical protein
MPVEQLSQVAQWRDLFQALDHAEQWYARWQKQGDLRADQVQTILQQDTERRKTWELDRDTDRTPPLAEVGMPSALAGESAAGRTLRYFVFLEKELQRHTGRRLLTLAQSHALLTEVRERQSALALQLGPQDIPEVVPAAKPARRIERYEEDDEDDEVLTVFPAPRARRRVLGHGLETARRPAPPPVPRRSMGEILLDPRNAQWLLAFGGALMVIGLVILLWVNDYIAPPTVAIGLGIINAGLLLGGWYMLLKTRFAIAGQGLTLLACMVMPLNLWYYHANDLLTISGHLWVAAVVMTALYAASAWVLRSELFVFVFVGGLTLTGMLFLAMQQNFWQIAAPATFLVVLGVVCIHAERAFSTEPGPFSRKRFGLAFFFSGHALLAVGLMLVFFAEFFGNWLYEPIFKEAYRLLKAEPSPIARASATLGDLRWLAILLVAVGTYAYVYSDLVVRKLGVYVYIAAFTLCWLLALCLEYFHFGFGIDVAIVVLAVASLVINILNNTVLKDNPVARALPYLGLLLPLLAMMLGLVVYLTHISPDLKSVWKLEKPDWGYVAAMAVTAIACRVAAYLYRLSNVELSFVYHFGAAGATMIGATALAAAIGLEEWQEHAPILILLPVVYLLAAWLYQGYSAEVPMLWVANAALVVMLFSSISTAFDGFTHFVEQRNINLILALFFAEAALFYGLAAALVRQPAAVHCCTAMACAVVWQLLTYFGVAGEYYALVFAVVGVALLLSYRFGVLEGFTQGRYAEEAFESGNTLLCASFAVTFALGMNRLATNYHPWGFITLCIGMSLVGLAAVFLVKHKIWRQAYLVLTLLQFGLTFLSLMVLTDLKPGQKVEIICVAMGLVLLAMSHYGWYREQERHDDLVTFGLLLGSLLVGLPLAIATLSDRLTDTPAGDKFRVLNEVGFLASGVLLLASGILCQLRATTITGAALTLFYFLTLVMFRIPWYRLNAVAWFILVGGTVVFSAGLALSVFRERLLTLPERFKRREGVWRVLKWR